MTPARRTRAVAGYRHANGLRHDVLIRQTSLGDWQVLDSCEERTLVVDELDGAVDGRPQAEALAHEYAASAAQVHAAAGNEAAEPIPETGGTDAERNRHPCEGARNSQARRVAVPRAAR